MLPEIDRFVNWVRRRNPNAHTWREYRADLKQFLAVVGDPHCLRDHAPPVVWGPNTPSFAIVCQVLFPPHLQLTPSQKSTDICA
jgi:hypothetical protein